MHHDFLETSRRYLFTRRPTLLSRARGAVSVRRLCWIAAALALAFLWWAAVRATYPAPQALAPAEVNFTPASTPDCFPRSCSAPVKWRHG